jgi:hypothetical protein
VILAPVVEDTLQPDAMVEALIMMIMSCHFARTGVRLRSVLLAAAVSLSQVVQGMYLM